MGSEPPVAVYDACVLYPFHLRNVLVQCAVERLVEARWTDDIHEEWIRNLAAATPGLSADRLRRTRDLMKAVLPAAEVTGHRALINDIELPDPDDCHVVAAAVAGGASLIVSWNLRDFPVRALAPYSLACVDPDTFLCERFAALPDVLLAALANARHNLRQTSHRRVPFLRRWSGRDWWAWYR